MAAKPLTTEAIAMTEKKMDMTLDDIIKMSKQNTSKVKKQRVPNKSQKFFNGGAPQANSAKVRRFMDSRSSLRQGLLAKRRSNLQGNQFPLAAEAARKAMAAPIRNRPLNRSRGGVNWSKPRIGAPVVQRRTEGSLAVKKKQQQQMKATIKPRPQTLDSLFANMKEQRLKTQQSNGKRGLGPQQRLGRGRFGNFTR